MTSILDLLEEEDMESIVKEIDYDNLREMVLDLSIDPDVRLIAFQEYHAQDSVGDDAIELINTLAGMYHMGGTKLIEKFLYDISISNNISLILRIEACKALLGHEEFEEGSDSDDDEQMIEIKEESNKNIRNRNKARMVTAYDALDQICENLNRDIPTPCRIEVICILMKSDDYKDNAARYFNDFLIDDEIDCGFRYKTILSLEKMGLEDYIHNAQKVFLLHPTNLVYYKILSAQYILQKTQEDTIFAETELLIIAEDTTIDYDRRADAADVLIQLGTSGMKRRGQEIILSLGRIDGTVRTVFENAQNVHVQEVEESVSHTLEFLSGIPLQTNNEIPIDFEYVAKRVKMMLDSERNRNIIKGEKCKFCGTSNDENLFCNGNCRNLYYRENKILLSLDRIQMDRALYSKYNNTLVNILLKVWSYTIGHEYETEMHKRLLEELEEMSGTCSSGFASRLINTISGFGEFNIRISWEDQIIANLYGRLNARAREIASDRKSIFYTTRLNEIVEIWLNSRHTIKQQYINELNSSDCITKDPTMSELVTHYLLDNREEKISECVQDFADSVVMEMTESSNFYGNRQNFSLFLRSVIASIREDMYSEYKEHLDDTTFDLYMRKAMMVYEGEI